MLFLRFNKIIMCSPPNAGAGDPKAGAAGAGAPNKPPVGAGAGKDSIEHKQ